MTNQEKVNKAIELFGAGPTHWIAQQVDLTEREVMLIHLAYSRGWTLAKQSKEN